MSRKVMFGEVVHKRESRCVVLVKKQVLDPLYKKKHLSYKKYHVHCVRNVALGEEVFFMENPPLSKSKKWVLLEK